MSDLEFDLESDPQTRTSDAPKTVPENGKSDTGKENLVPFLGKGKELPERTRRILVGLMERAAVVEDEGSVRRMQECPVCAVKIDIRLMSVEPAGRKRELIPGQLVHFVLAHDFWHPSMDVLLGGPPREAPDGPDDPGTGGSDLPFSEFSDASFFDLEPTVDSRQPTADGRRTVDEARHRSRPTDLTKFEDFDRFMTTEEDGPLVLGSRSGVRSARSPKKPVKRRDSRVTSHEPRATSSPAAHEARSSKLEAHSSRESRVESREPAYGARNAGRVAARDSGLGTRDSTDPEAEEIRVAYEIPPDLAYGLAGVARAVGGHPFDLANLVWFESGFDPSAVGPSGAGAVGLIQFTDAMANKIGTTTMALRRMTAVQQLPFVRRHLDAVRTGRPLDTPHRLYMAVFWPTAMAFHPSDPFPDDVVRRNTFRTRSGETVSIRTASDYAALVEAGARLRPSSIPEVRPDGGGGGILDQVASFFSGLFGPPNGTAEPDRSSSAHWEAAQELDAVLFDPSGRPHDPGFVPAGPYELRVVGRPPHRTTLVAGRTYRASPIGRMFETVNG